MDIVTYNREEMERSQEEAPHIKIVLHDPELERPKITDISSCKAVLYLAFDDISYESQFDKIFTENDAKVVSDFFLKWSDQVSKILISCEAGLSRSPGVAAAIEEYLTQKESSLFYSFHQEPNMLVFKKLKAVLERTKALSS